MPLPQSEWFFSDIRDDEAAGDSGLEGDLGHGGGKSRGPPGEDRRPIAGKTPSPPRKCAAERTVSRPMPRLVAGRKLRILLGEASALL